MRQAIYFIFIFLSLPCLSFAAELTFSTFSGSVNSAPCITVLTKAYQRLGIKVIIQYNPGERSLVMANKGFVDGEVQRIKGIDKTYSNLVLVPHPIGLLQGCVFTKDLKFTPDNWKSLTPYRIGVMQGAKFTEASTSGMDRVIAYKHEKLFQFLRDDRIEAAVLGCLTGILLIQEKGFNEIAPLSPPIAQHQLFHYLHKRHKKIIPRLVAILENMEKSGEIKDIWEKYKTTRGLNQ